MEGLWRLRCRGRGACHGSPEPRADAPRGGRLLLGRLLGRWLLLGDAWEEDLMDHIPSLLTDTQRPGDLRHWTFNGAGDLRFLIIFFWSHFQF